MASKYNDWILGAKLKTGIAFKQNRRLLWHGVTPKELLEPLALQTTIMNGKWDASKVLCLRDAAGAAVLSTASRPPNGHSSANGQDRILLLYEADVGRARPHCDTSLEQAKRDYKNSRYTCVESVGRVAPGGWKSVKEQMADVPCQCGSWVMMVRCVPVCCNRSRCGSSPLDPQLLT